MNITKKIDRAFQWAGEKMGAEAKTTMSDEFKMLETEMALRYDGMDRLQKSMSTYVKWLGRRGETFEDGEKGLPASYLGRTMVTHGEDFEPDSEFGNCLISMGHANESIAGLQETLVADVTATWLESLERSLAMMKEFQAARKKLENRRLAYDTSINKMHKAKREDFRVEEELRTARAKYEESSEDVVRRMQDIKDAEADSVRDLTHFLDSELDYHERCAEELRRVRQNWAGPVQSGGASAAYGGGLERRPTARSRSNTARSYNERLSRTASSIYEAPQPEPEPQPVLMPIRSISSRPSMRMQQQQQPSSPESSPVCPPIGRSNTFQGGAGGGRALSGLTMTTLPSNCGNNNGNNQIAPAMGSLRGQLRPVSRIMTHDVFSERDDDTTASGSGSPEWGERSASPATSFGSLSRSTSNIAMNGTVIGGAVTGMVRKAPPPPPPSRSKKPPPPVPVKREVGY